jgi:hypothetical protein
MIRIRHTALVLMLTSVACSKPSGDGAGGSEPTQPPGAAQPAPRTGFDTSTDAVLRRLEREAQALARTDGCATVDQCRTAAVGSRPCGGPRYYLPYCRATTDSTALFTKLAELARAEEDYNRRNGLASTCEFRMPPDLEVVGGGCRARVPGGE